MSVDGSPSSLSFAREASGACAKLHLAVDMTLMQCAGRLHEHTETVFRVRRPAAAADADIPQFCGRRAATATKESDIQVPPAVPGEEAVFPPIFPQVSLSALNSLRGILAETGASSKFLPPSVLGLTWVTVAYCSIRSFRLHPSLRSSCLHKRS